MLEQGRVGAEDQVAIQSSFRHGSHLMPKVRSIFCEVADSATNLLKGAESGLVG